MAGVDQQSLAVEIQTEFCKPHLLHVQGSNARRALPVSEANSLPSGLVVVLLLVGFCLLLFLLFVFFRVFFFYIIFY